MFLTQRALTGSITLSHTFVPLRVTTENITLKGLVVSEYQFWVLGIGRGMSPSERYVFAPNLISIIRFTVSMTNITVYLKTVNLPDCMGFVEGVVNRISPYAVEVTPIIFCLLYSYYLGSQCTQTRPWKGKANLPVLLSLSGVRHKTVRGKDYYTSQRSRIKAIIPCGKIFRCFWRSLEEQIVSESVE